MIVLSIYTVTKLFVCGICTSWNICMSIFLLNEMQHAHLYKFPIHTSKYQRLLFLLFWYRLFFLFWCRLQAIKTECLKLVDPFLCQKKIISSFKQLVCIDIAEYIPSYQVVCLWCTCFLKHLYVHILVEMQHAHLYEFPMLLVIIHVSFSYSFDLHLTLHAMLVHAGLSSFSSSYVLRQLFSFSLIGYICCWCGYSCCFISSCSIIFTGKEEEEEEA